jgi:hypothetical protein
MKVRFLRGGGDLIKACPHKTVANVLFDRSTEDVVLLKHESDLATQQMSFVFRDVAAIEKNSAGCRSVEFA